MCAGPPSQIPPARAGIDWGQLLYPGPEHPFSADEMARAGGDGPSPTLVAACLINVSLIAFIVLQLGPAAQTARLAAAMLGMVVLAGAAARWLWWRAWRKPLMQVSLGVVVVMLALSVFIRWQLPDRQERYWLAAVLVGGGSLVPVLLWFLVIWRAQQIGSRLREQAEREQAIEMARRLAAAQVEPHFLFNTLASLQHWVQTKDDRAAPLLAALTGYLRATLPLFDKPLLAAGDELLAIERYLQVMQARMGTRLAWRIEVGEALRRCLLPPGLLLTLVENAVVHGAEPRLAGAEIAVRGRRDGADALFEVQDNGAGLAPGAVEGVGLNNLRRRLALHGGSALALHTPPGGGCLAQLRLPYRTE